MVRPNPESSPVAGELQIVRGPFEEFAQNSAQPYQTKQFNGELGRNVPAETRIFKSGNVLVVTGTSNDHRPIIQRGVEQLLYDERSDNLKKSLTVITKQLQVSNTVAGSLVGTNVAPVLADRSSNSSEHQNLHAPSPATQPQNLALNVAFNNPRLFQSREGGWYAGVKAHAATNWQPTNVKLINPSSQMGVGGGVVVGCKNVVISATSMATLPILTDGQATLKRIDNVRLLSELKGEINLDPLIIDGARLTPQLYVAVVGSQPQSSQEGVRTVSAVAGLRIILP